MSNNRSPTKTNFKQIAQDMNSNQSKNTLAPYLISYQASQLQSTITSITNSAHKHNRSQQVAQDLTASSRHHNSISQANINNIQNLTNYSNYKNDSRQIISNQNTSYSHYQNPQHVSSNSIESKENAPNLKKAFIKKLYSRDRSKGRQLSDQSEVLVAVAKDFNNQNNQFDNRFVLGEISESKYSNTKMKDTNLQEKDGRKSFDYQRSLSNNNLSETNKIEQAAIMRQSIDNIRIHDNTAHSRFNEYKDKVQDQNTSDLRPFILTSSQAQIYPDNSHNGTYNHNKNSLRCSISSLQHDNDLVSTGRVNQMSLIKDKQEIAQDQMNEMELKIRDLEIMLMPLQSSKEEKYNQYESSATDATSIPYSDFNQRFPGNEFNVKSLTNITFQEDAIKGAQSYHHPVSNKITQKNSDENQSYQDYQQQPNTQRYPSNQQSCYQNYAIEGGSQTDRQTQQRHKISFPLRNSQSKDNITLSKHSKSNSYSNQQNSQNQQMNSYHISSNSAQGYSQMLNHSHQKQDANSQQQHVQQQVAQQQNYQDAYKIQESGDYYAAQQMIPQMTNKELQNEINLLRQKLEMRKDYKQKYVKSSQQAEKYKLQFAHSEKIRQNQQTLIELQSQKISKLKQDLKRYKTDNQQLIQIVGKTKEVEASSRVGIGAINGGFSQSILQDSSSLASINVSEIKPSKIERGHKGGVSVIGSNNSRADSRTQSKGKSKIHRQSRKDKIGL